MKQSKIVEPYDLSKEELLEFIPDLAKNWLAHDGLWFLCIEQKYGIESAIELDKKAWEKFTVIEAERIMKRLNIEPNSGITGLIQALKFRLYAFINKQEIIEISDKRCVLRMNNCRVQEARKRKGLPDFPCKPVGIVEYAYFAQTIDSRIKTNCITCPPDSHPDDYFCAWEFVLQD
ncbi:MAG: DUF6125 family protein [bacterium]